MKKRIIYFALIIIVITIIGIVVAYIHNYNINSKKKYDSDTYEETLFDTSYVHKINIKISKVIGKIY